MATIPELEKENWWNHCFQEEGCTLASRVRCKEHSCAYAGKECGASKWAQDIKYKVPHLKISGLWLATVADRKNIMVTTWLTILSKAKRKHGTGGELVGTDQLTTSTEIILVIIMLITIIAIIRAVFHLKKYPHLIVEIYINLGYCWIILGEYFFPSMDFLTKTTAFWKPSSIITLKPSLSTMQKIQIMWSWLPISCNSGSLRFALWRKHPQNWGNATSLSNVLQCQVRGKWDGVHFLRSIQCIQRSKCEHSATTTSPSQCAHSAMASIMQKCIADCK